MCLFAAGLFRFCLPDIDPLYNPWLQFRSSIIHFISSYFLFAVLYIRRCDRPQLGLTLKGGGIAVVSQPGVRLTVRSFLFLWTSSSSLALSLSRTFHFHRTQSFLPPRQLLNAFFSTLMRVSSSSLLGPDYRASSVSLSPESPEKGVQLDFQRPSASHYHGVLGASYSRVDMGIRARRSVYLLHFVGKLLLIHNTGRRVVQLVSVCAF